MQTYAQDIEKLLKEGNSIQLKPQGYSMYPLLIPGRDEVVVSPIEDIKNLRRGQVVLYRRYKENGDNDILVLHRIWRVKEQGIFLVGDNQKEIEGPLQASQMLGIATTLYRKGKAISTKNIVYRFLTGVWLNMRPIRPMISKSVAFCKRVLGKVHKGKKDS